MYSFEKSNHNILRNLYREEEKVENTVTLPVLTEYGHESIGIMAIDADDYASAIIVSVVLCKSDDSSYFKKMDYLSNKFELRVISKKEFDDYIEAYSEALSDHSKYSEYEKKSLRIINPEVVRCCNNVSQLIDTLERQKTREEL